MNKERNVGIQEWAAVGALVLAMFSSAIGVVVKLVDNKNVILERIHENKESLDIELLAIRMAAYEEYKILRREMTEQSDKSYREFGESLHGIREKMTQIELWIRDELSKTRHTLTGSMDMRHQMLEEKIELIDSRIRHVEIEQARQNPGVHMGPRAS